MKTVYFLVPGIALAIFTFFYMGFSKEYEAAAVAKEEAAKQANIDRMKQEAKDRETAIKEALALNADRRAERAKKDAAELARKEARQNATDALELARSERKRLSERLDALERDIDGVEAEIKTLQDEKILLAGSAEHLRSFVTEAENNKMKFESVIQDIRQAERAHAAALVAAANAEK